MTAKKPASAKATKVADVRPAPVKAAPAKAATLGDNLAAVYRGIREAAASATMGRTLLVDRIKDALANNLGDPASLAALRHEALIGAMAGKVALAAGRKTPSVSDYAEGAILLKRAGAGAEKANSFGKRTEEQERWYGAARTMWSGACDDAGVPRQKGRQEAGKASAAKRGARTTSVTKVATVKAKGSEMAPTVKAAPHINAPAEAMAWVLGEASRIKTFAEVNAKVLGKELAAKVAKLASELASLELPK